MTVQYSVPEDDLSEEEDWVLTSLVGTSDLHGVTTITLPRALPYLPCTTPWTYPNNFTSQHTRIYFLRSRYHGRGETEAAFSTHLSHRGRVAPAGRWSEVLVRRIEVSVRCQDLWCGLHSPCPPRRDATGRAECRGGLWRPPAAAG